LCVNLFTGIAHRDVKPENVLCSDFDHVSPVKLCDLDLASKAVSPSPPKLQSVNSEPDLASPVGSAEFMAPEVVDAFVGDALKYDKRCDMWSLGVIVYIMLCGYPPFYGQCWRENCGWDQATSGLGSQYEPSTGWGKAILLFPLVAFSLLPVKNVRERFTADEVLKHPWIRNGAPETKLQTPGNLFRSNETETYFSNDSARDVHQIQEHFNVMNRIVAARLSARLERSDPETDDVESERNADVSPPIEYAGTGIVKQNGVLTDVAESLIDGARSLARAEMPRVVVAATRVVAEPRHHP
uniref:Protein kinase domain-containing protein n=1 Tax=Parascaris equorum TaxID=6256 RepID=A0A914S2C9_PAREQ